MHEKALKIRRRALGEDHVNVAKSLGSIGIIHSKQGKHAEALEMYGRTIATFDRALGVDSRESAGVYYCIAYDKQQSCDAAGALESARESVRIYTKLGVRLD
jgi:tetratricopeptide (TPR) repeat protein